jgi:hypothetical protein
MSALENDMKMMKESSREDSGQAGISEEQHKCDPSKFLPVQFWELDFKMLAVLWRCDDCFETFIQVYEPTKTF